MTVQFNVFGYLSTVLSHSNITRYVALDMLRPPPPPMNEILFGSFGGVLKIITAFTNINKTTRTIYRFLLAGKINYLTKLSRANNR